MHRTDGDANVGNMFDGGDPLVPRLPTQVDPAWLNAVQEEIVNVIVAAGIALVKGTNNQLLSALNAAFVRVTTDQDVGGVKTFLSQIVAAAGLYSGGGGVRVDLESDVAGGRCVRSTVYDAGIGIQSRVSAAALGALAIEADGGADNRALRIVPQIAPPASPQQGDLHVQSSTGKLYIYDGSAWVVVGTQT